MKYNEFMIARCSSESCRHLSILKNPELREYVRTELGGTTWALVAKDVSPRHVGNLRSWRHRAGRAVRSFGMSILHGSSTRRHKPLVSIR